MEKTKAKISYFSLNDEDTAAAKRDWFGTTKFEDIRFESIQPDKGNNWVNLAEESDWEDLLSVAEIFSKTVNGVATGRDEWVYNLNKNLLSSQIRFIIDQYTINLGKKEFDLSIKWTEKLKSYHKANRKIAESESSIVKSNYRPFSIQNYYADFAFSDRLTNNHADLFGQTFNFPNKVIVFTGPSSQKPFLAFGSQFIVDWHFVGAACSSICLGLYRYDSSGNRLDNITDWGLAKFRNHYTDESIEKESIFHYVYAVLHNPAYRKKYELNLKREFPRIPFYDNFTQWAAWGKELMDLHIGYETVEPWPLELVTAQTRPEMKKQKELFETAKEPDTLYGYQAKPKVKLKADKLQGIIELDELSLLKGIPTEAWEYKLGNRSALEWILDQYKEKKPSDPTIAEKFNTYRFADYKEKVIDLLMRVTRVSVETVRIVGEMEKN